MKSYRVKNKFGDIEPHEVFLDKLAHAKEEELGISGIKFEVPLKETMSYLLFGIFLLLAIALLSKTFYFQIVEGKQMQVAAENNKGSANIIMPERGVIYDKNLKKLVSNSPAFDLICDRAHFSVSSEQTINEISDIATSVQANPADIENKIQQGSSSQVLVAEDITHDNLLVLETKMSNLAGCLIQQNTARDYIYGPSFSQVLGYTARINQEEYSNSSGYTINGYIGKTGLEKYYETDLRGIPGQSKVVKTASGIAKTSEILAQPQAGDNLILNIDADLQQRLYDALAASIQKMGGKKGAAVAMDPRTGAVLALVSYPSYDDNAFSNGISQTDYNKIINDPSQPLFDRAIAAKYPTGSTNK